MNKQGIVIPSHDDRMKLVKILANAGYSVKIEKNTERHTINTEYTVFYWGEVDASE